VIAVHSHEPLAEYTSARGVYFAAQVENLRALLNLVQEQSEPHESTLKIIVGQANWEARQLDAEFAAGCWLPLPVSSKVVFADKNTMWQQAMREVGNLYVAAIAGCGVLPPSVLVN
jgi:putative AlgH/UPF0301 family transcriptional regulator